MEAHYYSCPKCEGVFRLSQEKLTICDDMVRCGACGTVFDAKQTLLEKTQWGLIPVLNEKIVNDSDSFLKPDILTGQQCNDFRIQTGKVQLGPTQNRLQSTVPDSNISSVDKPNRDESDVDVSIKILGHHRTSWSDDVFANDPEIDAGIDPFYSSNERHRLSSPLISSRYEQMSDNPFEPIVGADEPMGIIRDSSKENEKDWQQITQCTLDGSACVDEFPADNPLLRFKSDEVSFTRSNYNQVGALIKDKPHPINTFMWFCAVLVMVFVLGLQVKYFFVESYAQNPKLKSYFVVFCKIARCQLPVSQAPELITLTHTKVDLHPNYPEAVRVTIKMLNEAQFDQPYPDIQLTLFDRLGKVVGRRVFEPMSYLDKDSDSQLLIHQQAPISVYLDLAHPHEKAVGYEVKIREQSLA